MAKRGIQNHPKTLALAERLDIPACYVVGILECLWQWVAEHRPTGDLTASTPRQIAIAIGYEPDRKRPADGLVDALSAAGFLDVGERLLVHDWSDHAPDYVHTRLARAGLTFADGRSPSDRKLTKDERAQLAERPRSASKAPGERPASAQETLGERPAVAVAAAVADARPLPGLAAAAAAGGGGEVPGVAPGLVAEVVALRDRAAAASGGQLDGDAVMLQASGTERGARATDPSRMSAAWLLRTRAELLRMIADFERARPASEPPQPDLPEADPEAAEAWERALDRVLESGASPAIVSGQLRRLVPVSLRAGEDGGRITLQAPSFEHAKSVQQGSLWERVLAAAALEGLRQVRIEAPQPRDGGAAA